MLNLAWVVQRGLQQVNVWDGPQRKGRTSRRTRWAPWRARRRRQGPPRNTIEIQVRLRQNEDHRHLEMSSGESSRLEQGILSFFKSYLRKCRP